MAEGTFLSDDFLRELTATGEVDILVGVPTSNNRETIERVVNAVRIGLVKYFPRERTVVINPDAGSRDGTRDLVAGASVQDFRSVLAATPLRTMHTITTRYHPSRGQGEALHLILAAADLLRAKACAIVTPDILSITPEWIDALARPIYHDGYDFLAPVYQRHKFDGLLIKNILSPFVSAAYGCRIEEPAGGEFGFSGKLACDLLARDVWHEDFMSEAPEVWMTAAALAGDYRIGQSFLGPKIQSTRSPGEGLATTIQYVMGALLRSLEMHEAAWISRNGTRNVASFGFRSELDLGPLRVNRKRMFEMFRTGVAELSSILEKILSAQTLEEVRAVSQRDENNCYFPDELWVRTVYEFAASYHHSVMNRDHLLQALTPLYRGRVSSYLLENHGASLSELRARIESLHSEYERLRPFLLKGWHAKEST